MKFCQQAMKAKRLSSISKSYTDSKVDDDLFITESNHCLALFLKENVLDHVWKKVKKNVLDILAFILCMFSGFQVNCIVEHQVQFLGFTLIFMDVRNHFNCTEQTKVYKAEFLHLIVEYV